MYLTKLHGGIPPPRITSTPILDILIGQCSDPSMISNSAAQNRSSNSESTVSINNFAHIRTLFRASPDLELRFSCPRRLTNPRLCSPNSSTLRQVRCPNSLACCFAALYVRGIGSSTRSSTRSGQPSRGSGCPDRVPLQIPRTHKATHLTYQVWNNLM